jgi:hypothetical protein
MKTHAIKIDHLMDGLLDEVIPRRLVRERIWVEHVAPSAFCNSIEDERKPCTAT